MIEINSSACCQNLQIIVEYTLVTVGYVYLGVCFLQMVFFFWGREKNVQVQRWSKWKSSPTLHIHCRGSLKARGTYALQWSQNTWFSRVRRNGNCLSWKVWQVCFTQVFEPSFSKPFSFSLFLLPLLFSLGVRCSEESTWLVECHRGSLPYVWDFRLRYSSLEYKTRTFTAKVISASKSIMSEYSSI